MAQLSQPSNAPPLDCPHCGRTITWSEDYPERPFCSKRCRDIDFGTWASEGYRIPGEPVDEWTLDESADDDNPLQ
ncbi:MAG: DNA gyrase inhibitor YacG [Oleiphilaceae bacterium]|nr:DNA gyrase inhibitor YacG [Oleiphilaceae bacterium]